MQVRVIAVGTRMPGWVDEAVDAYAKRMPPELRVEWRAEARRVRVLVATDVADGP